MTDARIQNVAVDLAAADRYLSTARRMLDDAGVAGLSDEARYTLIYDAARNAVTAALRASGLRVTAGSRAHVVTFDAARSVLGQEHADTLRRIDGVRRVRHQIEYETREVSSTELDAIDAPARAIVDAAARLVAAARKT